jgi:serine/threonine protein kinase
LAGKVLGRYYLLEQIGIGGVATVYKALDLERNDRVAIKVMSSHLAATPQFQERFSREVKVLRSLQHPRVVPILDYGDFDDQPFIVMPFYQDSTLAKRLQERPLSPLDAAKLISQLAEALSFAHQQGIVHRDLKPSNILLDEDGNAYLTDFGFAQITDASLSLTGSAMIGTPAYMSPEQCKGEPIDARSDQYSLAVLLYQLTTGRLPFDADTPMAIAIKHVNEPVPSPRKVSPNLPSSIERVLIKGMAKKPADRYASVAELNLAFQEALASALDPFGNLIPDPADHPTVPLPRLALLNKLRERQWWIRRRAALGSLALLLVFIPAAWALSLLPPAGASPGGDFVTPTDLMATIRALSTELARPNDGETLSNGEVGTAVHGTLIAQGALPAGGALEATETPTPTAGAAWVWTWFASRTPTRTPYPGGSSEASATPTPGPSPTRTRTPSPAPEPSRTATPSPLTSTPTLAPPTSTPVAATPTPIPPTATAAFDPKLCRAELGHPHYCTPTPGP